MNMAYNSDQERSFDYQSDEPVARREKAQQKNRPSHSQKRAPSSFNGMHRRRNKRFSW
jgi:hypothetical protein